MATKVKKFDCVEMKRRAQEQLSAEWERRRHEFSSYGDFLEATVTESEWSRRIWEKARQQESPTSV
jgi:hypothetical protein